MLTEQLTPVQGLQTGVWFDSRSHSFFLPRAFFTKTGLWLPSRALALLTAAYAHHQWHHQLPMNF